MARRGSGGLLAQLARTSKIGLLFVVVIGGLWYWQQGDVRDRLSWMGVPAWQWDDWRGWNRVLTNDGFLVGWSDLRAEPLWAGYALHRVDDPHSLPRPDHFSQDWRSLWPIRSDDYTGSGYDRGHLAPNYAMSVVNGEGGQADSFLMTNITPQRPKLNRQLWQRLEEAVMDDFVPRFGSLWVMTGPVFDDQWLHRIGFSQVPVAFYKILVVPGATPRAIAFLMPQDVSGHEPLDRYLVTIDEIEARTGLDFFPQLADDVERRLEGRVDRTGWGLEAVANRPGRFQ
ncbi:DNA/RNA non-specific endonuclease [Salinicola rhizosphaerae]|uniref:DNA/RNA non-specific endonuclease n=1 Tax=Salinicola rhizosphaerae TaxID=1443141 RepID=A0ABQ3DXG5_9GAMM|nr:DNA/RNA non-specific endonuclease [Salinicola rhizosphaerae]GHB16745.1 DNA/RNA non-specific endonuclease [Salinicola rhizosphaerae]